MEAPFKEGELVFCRETNGNTSDTPQWHAAMIIPASEIRPAMCNEQLKSSESLVRLFDDYSYSIKERSDLYRFSEVAEPYILFQERASKLEFNQLSNSEKGISRCITFANRCAYLLFLLCSAVATHQKTFDGKHGDSLACTSTKNIQRSPQAHIWWLQ